MTRTIEDLTIREFRELNNLFSAKTNSKEHPFEIGKAYFIRTVTMNLVGKLEKVFESELVLSDASWVADSGRFHDALSKGLEKQSNAEIEPFPNDVIIGRGSIIDATEFSHKLPKEQK